MLPMRVTDGGLLGMGAPGLKRVLNEISACLRMFMLSVQKVTLPFVLLARHSPNLQPAGSVPVSFLVHPKPPMVMIIHDF